MDFLLVILATLPGLAVSALIFRLDKYDREPLLALALCFALGALVTVPSVALERWAYHELAPWRGTLGGTAVLAFFGVALNEELFKFAVLLVAAFPFRYYNEPLDGIVYAVMIAMGFATLENIVYVRNYGMGSMLIRAFTAVPAHFVFAVVQGYYAGLAKFATPRRRFRLLRRGFLQAVALHGLYDFLILQRWSAWLVALATFGLYFGLFYIGRYVERHQDSSPFRGNR